MRVQHTHLSAPLWVDRVAHDDGAFLLAVVGQGGEDAVLPRLDRELQVGVRVEEHPLLQPRGLEVWPQERGEEAGSRDKRANMRRGAHYWE